MKRIITWLCLALCLILPAVALANVDIDHAASLTLRLTDGGVGAPGATFDVYHIAAMNSDARFELLPGYDIGSVDINKVQGAQAWQALADTLAKQVTALTASATTNADGNAAYGSMDLGLYLVIGKPVEIGAWAYEFAPFMVSVPGKDGEAWVYDVIADVKHARSPLLRDIQVVKVWKDEGYSKVRPARILVDLYCDGELAHTVELSADNNWSYEWIDMERVHEWTVKEQVIPSGYVAEYTEKDGALVITNTLTAPPTAPPDIPQTGLTWWPVPLMAVLGAALFIIGWAMRRKWRNEHDQA